MSSCGCSSSPVTATSQGGCATIVHSRDCTAPRRVANPPSVPVTFNWASRLRSAAQGQLLVSNGCDELMKLEGFISGPVMFDAGTGMSYVGSGAAQYIMDAFPCSDEAPYGFPAYGLDPGCRNSGDNPDREVAVIRPRESSIGTPFGHLTGPPNQGLDREISPVHLVPEPLPSTPPTDTFLWLCKELPADDECNARRYQWYKATASQAFSTLPTAVAPFALPAAPLTAAQDAAFGLAVWVYENNNFVIKKATNETFQNLLKATNSAKWLEAPGTVIFEQVSQGTASEGRAVALSGLPMYFAEAVEAVLFLVLVTDSPADTGMIWSNTFFIDGRQYMRGTSQRGPAPQSLTSQITVPIPPSKILNLNFIRETYLNGDLYGDNRCGFVVTLQAFR